MMLKYITLIGLSLVTTFTFSQHKKNCHFHEHEEKRAIENSNYLLEKEKLERESKQFIEKFRQKRIQNTIYKIPVVVHIIYQTEEPQNNISDEQILEQIDVLNEDFRKTNSNFNKTPTEFQPLAADVGIEFQLATTDPNGNDTIGITRTITTINEIGETNKYYKTASGGIDAWNNKEYLNIWVCELATGSLGFAYPPSSSNFDDDGIVVSPDFFGRILNSKNLGRTATHEIGHYFNLLHVWGNSGGCSNDDNVEDTPIQEKENYGVPVHPSISCTSPDLFNNYMDYVDDSVMTLFTNGQKERMLAALLGPRKSLLSSRGLNIVNNTQKISTKNIIVKTNLGNKTLEVQSTNSEKITLTIFSSIGILIKKRTISTNQSIDISTLSFGTYFLKVEQNNIILTEKILIY